MPTIICYENYLISCESSEVQNYSCNYMNIRSITTIIIIEIATRHYLL